MWQKSYFLVALVFFILMNVLLWRSQYGHKDLALPIPVETVTRRMFSATDDSNLDIIRHGARIGYCRWSPQTISQVPTPGSHPDAMPEGMVGGITSYSISFDGTLMLEDAERIRFTFSLELDTNFVWSSVRVRLVTPDYRIEATSDIEDQAVHFTSTQGNQSRQIILARDDLRDPRQWLDRLGGGMIARLWGTTGLGTPEGLSQRATLGLDWEAHTDRQRLGNASFPVYRLQTELLETYFFRVTILPSGELLRVELPGDVVLVNDKLTKM